MNIGSFLTWAFIFSYAAIAVLTWSLLWAYRAFRGGGG